MLGLTRIFGSRNQRLLRGYGKNVQACNGLEDTYAAMSDGDVRELTDTFKKHLDDGATLDSLIPEAFAAVREASKRTLGMRHFDVQLIGGMVLHDGKIAEMRTGEGKTLVATLPAYLNALTGHGVHIVTVNDYLAARDAEWMRPIYEFLGLTTGVIRSGQETAEKREAYSADVIYGTNNEFGFDYLRDNLAFTAASKAQGELSFAIVDEVDSILIDEARTPLIISGPAESSTDLYQRIDKLIPKLTRQKEEEGPGDYWVEEKNKQVHVSEDGHVNLEQVLASSGLIGEGESLYAAANMTLLHHVNAGLRAHNLFTRDVDYIVKDGEIVIVDEFTGRTMPGRRWSDGLHQAVEAKEGVNIRQENQTLASITFQNLFRMYSKLSGMTGTADTEAFEFQDIYGLEVAVIPTHKPMIRDDRADLVFLNENDKFDAVVEDILDCNKRGQPVLVGTTSIETSEKLSGVLKKNSITHEVLNAKQHAREAEIVAQAGQPGSVTIATNMAGRGTDIVLGGNLEAELSQVDEDDKSKRDAATAEWRIRHEKVLEEGGLHIVGTERHESRRIDNQLRGRSGRQGDPGSSRFFLSLDDNLMRIFGDPERTKNLLSRVGMKEGEAIESRMLSKQIEKAQRKVESHNFDIRKHLLEYDDVANDQRKVIYHQRNELMAVDDLSEDIATMREDAVNDIIDNYIPRGSLEEQWDPTGLAHAAESDFGLRLPVAEWVEKEEGLIEEDIRDRVLAALVNEMNQKSELIGEHQMRLLEKQVWLQQLDMHWKEHLAAMDHLRSGINLRGFAQKNPKQEYKREAFQMFVALLDRIKHDTISLLSRVRVHTPEEIEEIEKRRRAEMEKRMRFQHAAAASLTQQGEQPGPGGRQQASPAEPHQPYVRESEKVGRNAPCPCGSGKKFKQCHGRVS